MLNLEVLKEDRLKLMVIVDKIYSGHCASEGGTPHKNLAYVNATHRLYNYNDYDEDFINYYRWLEEEVILSILKSLDKLLKKGLIKPVEISCNSIEILEDDRLLEFVVVVINIIATQNYKQTSEYLCSEK